MTAATALRFGQINGAGDADALFLKVFAGEVLTAFDTAQIMMPLHLVRTIQSGKSAQFPVTWKVNASYHTVGAEIVGQTSNANERIINVDDYLIADVFTAEIDELMNHYDARSIYSHQVAEALGQEFDKHILQLCVLASRAGANVTGGQAGESVTNASLGTSGTDCADAIFDAAQKLDEHDVPETERFAVFKPAQYYLLAQTTNVLNKDWGGRGSYADGKVLEVAGVTIRKSNNLPSTNIATGPTAYQGDFTNTKGVVFHKSAVGTVKLRDLSVMSQYDLRRLGTLIVAKLLLGSDYLRPESSIELKTA